MTGSPPPGVPATMTVSTLSANAAGPSKVLPLNSICSTGWAPSRAPLTRPYEGLLCEKYGTEPMRYRAS